MTTILQITLKQYFYGFTIEYHKLLHLCQEDLIHNEKCNIARYRQTIKLTQYLGIKCRPKLCALENV